MMKKDTMKNVIATMRYEEASRINYKLRSENIRELLKTRSRHCERNLSRSRHCERSEAIQN